MSSPAIFVTGAGRHSLGEAIVAEYLRRDAAVKIITATKLMNPDLQRDAGVHQMVMDLNPLNHPAGVKGFAAEFLRKVEDAIRETGADSVRCLVQSAAIYDFGRFLEHDLSRRVSLLGLNVLGSTEVLYGVMYVNSRLGLANEAKFTQMFVGAFQGLQVRSKRPLYASSKAWGLDLCTSLAAGGELGRCIYAAPVPIDTPMLHRNHWVRKCSGSEQFFDFVLHGPREEYESIFIQCDEDALIELAGEHFADTAGNLRTTLDSYRAERLRARSSELGIMKVADCAKVLVDIDVLQDYRSGVYLIGLDGSGNPVVKAASFGDLSRYDMFLSVAKNI